MGEQCHQDRIDLYLQCLEDLDFNALKGVLAALLLECRWFPKIPEIREAVNGKPADPQALENANAEAGWLRVLALANKWHPDIGAYRDAPKISARDSRALRIVGDIYRLWELQDEGGRDLDFMHKRYLEAWKQGDMISEKLELTRGRKANELGEGFSSFADIIKGA